MQEALGSTLNIERGRGERKETGEREEVREGERKETVIEKEKGAGKSP